MTSPRGAARRSSEARCGRQLKIEKQWRALDGAGFLRWTAPRVLVEASPVDRIWGIGPAADDERAADPNRWRGPNLLGLALMQVRDQL